MKNETHRTKIKLCGLSRPEDIDAANELMPNFIGFVFVEGSKRYVPFEKAAALKRGLSREIQVVGVFQDAPLEFVAFLQARDIIDIAQLHGNEDEAYLEELRLLTNKPVIKAFKSSDMATEKGQASVDDGSEGGRHLSGSKLAESIMKSTAEFIMLDSPEPGSGRAFDGELASLLGENATRNSETSGQSVTIIQKKRDIFLAGGLNPENVGAAIKKYRPFAVDVSSGIETDGFKDKEKMRAFCEAVRRADRELNAAKGS